MYDKQSIMDEIERLKGQIVETDPNEDLIIKKEHSDIIAEIGAKTREAQMGAKKEYDDRLAEISTTREQLLKQTSEYIAQKKWERASFKESQRVIIESLSRERGKLEIILKEEEAEEARLEQERKEAEAARIEEELRLAEIAKKEATLKKLISNRPRIKF